MADTAPVELGQESGEVCYYLRKADGSRQLIYRAGIYAVNEVTEKDIAYYVRFLMAGFFI